MTEPYEHLEHFIEQFQQARGLEDALKALEAIGRLADGGHHGAALVFGQALCGRGICGGLLEGPGEHSPRQYFEFALRSPNALDRRAVRQELERLKG